MSCAVHWTEQDTVQCFLARHKLRLYWERTRELPPAADPGGVADVVIDPRTPPRVRARVRQALARYAKVFEGGRGGMPLPVKDAIVHIDLKADARPRRCAEPEWGHGPKKNVMTKWATEKLKIGEFEHAPESQWASRPHIVMKVKRGSTKESDDFGIRVCGDYVYVNSQCKRLQPNAPSARAALDRAKGHMAYWYTDGDRQYNGWRLDEKSRDIAALWTPLGLLRPTRLQFGLMNAGIVTQGRLRGMRQQKLSIYTREHSENIADDFTGWTDHRFDKGKPIVDWDGLATGFIEHLAMAHAENMSFKAKKTVFGAPSAEFWGHTLDVDGSRQADHNMAPGTLGAHGCAQGPVRIAPRPRSAGTAQGRDRPGRDYRRSALPAHRQSAVGLGRRRRSGLRAAPERRP